MHNISRATHKGEIELNNYSISVIILDNGIKLITKKSLFQLFGKTRRGRTKKKTSLSLTSTLSFVDIERLENLINTDLNRLLITIKYASVENKIEEGYNITLIPQLCNLFLRAKKKKLLNKNNLILAERSKAITPFLNKIDLNHLINNSFKFLFTNENKEVGIILKNYLTKEKLFLWKDLFQDSFYQDLFRLNGWEYSVLEIKKRPNILVKWIKELIFTQIPKVILQKIRDPDFKTKLQDENTFCKETKEIYLTLNSEINTVITLFKISENMKEFWNHFSYIKQINGIKINAPFKFDENGHTIELIDESLLSDFNKKLKTALLFNLKNS